MKNLITLTLVAIAFLSSCCKKDTDESSKFELTTLDSLTHDHATEILRLNILSEYGGAFRQMELYHTEVFDGELPCDSILNIEMIEDELPKYSINIPIELNTSCREAPLVYNNRFFRGEQKEGTQTAESELFALEILLNGRQSINGNFEDDAYTYGLNGRRNLLITKGIAPEIEPRGDLILHFPSCNYDQEDIKLTDKTIATFVLHIKTTDNTVSINSKLNEKKFEGQIQLIDGLWTVTFNVGIITTL